MCIHLLMKKDLDILIGTAGTCVVIFLVIMKTL